MKFDRHFFVTALAAGALVIFATACADAPTAPVAPRSAPPVSFDRSAPPNSPTLLSCPATTSASASAVIGPHGGRLSVGHFSMLVPPHAVQTPTLFTFDVPASQYLEVEIHAAGVEHYMFNRPVRITLDYSRCGDNFNPSALDAWYIDSNTKALISPMRGLNERGRDRLVFWTDHLSGYALAD